MTDKRCKCPMAISLTGDGCRYCQPQEHMDRLIEQMEEQEEESDAALHEAHELMHLMADELGCYADNPETRELLDVYNEYKEKIK